MYKKKEKKGNSLLNKNDQAVLAVLIEEGYIEEESEVMGNYNK